MQTPASVEAVIATQVIATRTDRRRDFKKEHAILQDLALGLAASDRSLLDRLVQAAVAICEAGSAGLSLHGTDSDGGQVLKWEAVAGEYAKYLGGTLPLFSPCGVCLERGRPELFDRPERAFTYFSDVRPEISEALVIPLRADKCDLGTIWIASHGGRQFTSADLSFMTTLANFTAAALTLRAREAAARSAACGERVERERAERASRLKDEFLSTISHELRTPLHAILSWSELLVAGLPATDAHEAVASIHRNAQRQVQLVDDLLDSSRHLGGGGMSMESQPVDVRALLIALVDGLRPALDTKELLLRFEDAPGPAWTVGDSARLQQAIGNVAGNAVKFSPPGGRVTIGCEPSSGRVLIRVSDQGIGIAENFLPLVFERFSQADSSSRRRQGGLGLGLAIARDILRAHGGDIEARSAGLGSGATFTLSIPLSAPPAPEPEVAKEVRLPSLQNYTLLVVDDETDACDALAMTLRRRGAVVHTAASAEQAVRTLAEVLPDAIVTDIAMPGADGYVLLQTIRQHENEAIRDVPVLAVTAYSSETDRARVLSAGFDAHVGKPTPGHDLVRTIARLLGAPHP